MKKKILAVALIMAMTASLAACGKTDEMKITLGEYKGIALRPVDEETVQQNIDQVVQNRFYEIKEAEGSVVAGDTVYINFVGKKDGVAFEGGTDDSEEGYPLVIGSNRFIDGFEDGIIGMNAGESKTLDLTFPEGYKNADLAGQAVQFDVDLKKITRKHELELNDENVKKVLELESVAEFRKKVTEDLTRSSFEEQIGEFLMENSKVENPPKEEIDEFTDQLNKIALSEINAYVQMYDLTQEQVVQSAFKMNSLEELYAYNENLATQHTIYGCILKEIANRENITVTEDEFKTRGEAYAKEYGLESLDALIEQSSREVVEDAILKDMVVDFLIENGKVF